MSHTLPRLNEIASHIAQHSRPDPDRPRMTPATERALDDVEKRSAVCYAGMEMLSMQFRTLAERIRQDDKAPTPEMPIDNDDSLAILIDEVKSRAKSEHAEADVRGAIPAIKRNGSRTEGVPVKAETERTPLEIPYPRKDRT